MSKVFYLILPIIMAGVSNMVFVKIPVLKFLKRPMDQGIILSDGKRVFGDNKTWKGFVGMIAFSAIWFVLFGVLARLFPACYSLSLIPYQQFSLVQGLLAGALWGCGYVLFELPNSYFKRRIDILPGKSGKGIAGAVFNFIDQADSVLGCLLMMLFFYIPTIQDWISIFILSVIVHYAMNVILYAMKLKSQPL